MKLTYGIGSKTAGCAAYYNRSQGGGFMRSSVNTVKADSSVVKLPLVKLVGR